MRLGVGALEDGDAKCIKSQTPHIHSNQWAATTTVTVQGSQ